VQKQIILQNVGPIEKLTIPLPDAGVVVLRGRNGVGKSHALAAVDSLVSGRGRPPCKDGQAKGLIEGFGARLTIGRSQRRTGEVEVHTLEGRLDISQLVQPPIKDEDAADRQRIKALIQLSGQSAEPEIFLPVLPNDTKLGELVGPSDQVDDPVVFAGRLKRALEAEARRCETIAESVKAKLGALLEQAKAVLPDLQGAGTVLSRDQAEAELRDALVAQKQLEAAAAEAERRRQQAQQAREALQRLTEGVAQDSGIESLQKGQREVSDQIEKLRRALDVALERQRQLQRQINQAEALRAQVAELENVIAAELPPIPAEALREAAEAVERARQQHARAIEADRVRELVRQADQLRKAAAEAEDTAIRYREAAKATDDVLTGLVTKVTRRLRVEAGRLVCDTERGVEAFAELSPGERWRIALEIAAEQVGQGGLVTVPQEAWESLDPVNRAEVASIARQVGVVILTAEADDHEEIVAEVA